MRHRTLLIIDDDSLWMRIAARYFATFNYKVLTATTCAEGLKLTQQYKPACVLLDFTLQEEDGSAYAAKVRENPELKRTPIIMVSGDEEQHLAAYTEYELDGFVLKGPACLKHLKATVESLLRRVNWDRDIVVCGDVRLEGANLQVFRDRKPVARLTAEQFRLLSVLLEKSPSFVSEEELFPHVYTEKKPSEKNEGIRGLAQRLRVCLGPQLGRRIKCKTKKGWIYIQPRARA